MPSSKLLRAAPVQRFEDYILTRVVAPGVGLYPIAWSAMSPVSGSVGTGGQDDAVSSPLAIGFDFWFSAVKYQKLSVSTNGWLALNDPASAFDHTHVIDGSSYMNHKIKQTFASNCVLMCPWFDDIRNTYDNMWQSGASLPAVQRVLRGFDIPSASYDQTRYAVKYANTIDASGMKCLIVRWSSFAYALAFNTILRFEVVLYENGKTEFRYDTRASISGNATSDVSLENATMGIFMNNDPDVGWRFRDMSFGFGYKYDNLRTEDPRGGVTYVAGFADTDVAANSAPYVITLTAAQPVGSNDPIFKGRVANWPGLDSAGCIMTFQPPVNRRKVLPRNELRLRDSRVGSFPLVARTGDPDRLGQQLEAFDDRRTLNYVTGTITVDYPTTLQRFYGSCDLSVVDRQDLFGDMLATTTGSIVKSSTDDFIRDTRKTYIKPFSDHGRPDQGPGHTSSYYATGSSPDVFGDALTSPLRSKTQITVELPLHHSLQMLETGSAIYYYNRAVRGMFMPQLAKSDVAHATGSTNTDGHGKYWTEDARGFGPIGDVVTSGSNPDPTDVYWQSDPMFGLNAAALDTNAIAISQVLSSELLKSVQNNPLYFATPDEQFTLPINQPFLVEKVVFELPFTMGEKWFDDRTTSTTPIGQGWPLVENLGIQHLSFDFAGPCITVALYNQVSSSISTHRDLITSGTIIPEGDNISSVVVRSTTMAGYGPFPLYLFEPEGFLSFGASPSAVVMRADRNLTFTGSVKVETTAGISNGLVAGLTIKATCFGDPSSGAGDPTVWSNLTKRYLMMPRLTLQPEYVNADTFTSLHVKSISPLGRSKKGFDPSGRSIFGHELTTFQNLLKDGGVPNPLFISEDAAWLPFDVTTALADPQFQAYFTYAVPLHSTSPSPYLVLPGDKLTLAVSKMRPALYSNGKDPNTGATIDFFRGSNRHDVNIATGSIKMTFYGSLLREGREHHDTLNQSLSSDAIHELVGAEPTCDQYDVEYNSSFHGAYTDDYITGSMLTRVSSARTHATLVTGSRGRVFSRLLARSQSVPASSPTTSYEVVQNASKAYRLQPWFERVGGQRTVRLASNSERFYDSMMPSLTDCMRADKSPIFLLASGSLFPAGRALPRRYGSMVFDYKIPNGYDPVNDRKVYNTNWSLSYPFEPRYASATRQLDASKNIVVDMRVSNLLSSVSSGSITATKIQQFVPIFFGDTIPRGTAHAIYAIDTDLSQYVSSYYQSGSMSSDDLTKVMFGFGDNNVRSTIGGGLGSNHLFEFRDSDNDTIDGARAEYAFSPVIRGWKYGVYSGLASYNTAVFRRNRYGQFRDMLEQRLFSKFYQTEIVENERIGPTTGPVTVRFIDSLGSVTKPENTWSQNLSLEVTSSVPYLDGVARNRTEINTATLNQSIVSLNGLNVGNTVI